MKPSHLFLCTLAISLLLASPVLALVTDNFNDNTIGQQWTTVVDDPTKLAINEVNQRLEITANAPTDPNLDANYLSNGPAGFLLSTSQDFNISIEYHFTVPTQTGSLGDALALDFGIGRDLPDGKDSAAIGFGYANVGTGTPFAQLISGYRVNDSPTNSPLLGGTSVGTFRLAYNSAGDSLTLSVDGNTGAGHVSTLSNLVKGTWNANAVYVSFGARGDGFNVTGSNAWLDNFSVDSGLIQAIPEPSTTALVLFGGLLSLLVFQKSRRQIAE